MRFDHCFSPELTSAGPARVEPFLDGRPVPAVGANARKTATVLPQRKSVAFGAAQRRYNEKTSPVAWSIARLAHRTFGTLYRNVLQNFNVAATTVSPKGRASATMRF